MAQDEMDAELESQLAVGDRAWADLCAVLDASDPDQPLRDPDSPDWTGRDVYTHFIRMHEGSANAIRSELAGRAVNWEPENTPQRVQAVERSNDVRVEEDRKYSFNEARAGAQVARLIYRELVCSLTVDQWRAFGRKHSDDLLGGHYEGHLRYIQGAAS